MPSTITVSVISNGLLNLSCLLLQPQAKQFKELEVTEFTHLPYCCHPINHVWYCCVYYKLIHFFPFLNAGGSWCILLMRKYTFLVHFVLIAKRTMTNHHYTYSLIWLRP